MSRRSFPHIDPSALRDHADEARVERVWDRIDHDLSSRPDRWGPNGFEAARARRSVFTGLAMAAAIGAFGVGLGVGKVTWGSAPAEAPVAKPIIEKASIEVLAAGTLQRTFPLPGGGRLTLSPGTTAELERAGDALTLRLLQGEAAVDTAGAARSKLALVAGEARLETKAGGVISVRRNQDELDVRVDDGAVSVISPAGSQELAKGEHAEHVPLHSSVASSAPAHAAPPRVPLLHPRGPAKVADPKAANVPDWLARYNASDYPASLALLRKRGVEATIAGASNATELLTIADLMRKEKDQTAVVLAYKHVLDAFPGEGQGWVAAQGLERAYLNIGQTELAQQYHDRALLLAPDAVFCTNIRTEVNKTEAARLATMYLKRYPNGQCHEEFDKMLQGSDAPAGADPAAAASADPSAPPAPPAAPAP